MSDVSILNKLIDSVAEQQKETDRKLKEVANQAFIKAMAQAAVKAEEPVMDADYFRHMLMEGMREARAKAVEEVKQDQAQQETEATWVV